MVLQTETPPDSDAAGPSLRTLAVIALGVSLAIGAAFFVRPSPKLDDKGTNMGSVVPAAALTVGAPRQDPAPAPAATPAPTPAPEPALSPDRQQLARLMSQAAADPSAATTRSIKLAPAPPPAVPPGVSAFAAAPEQPGAMQALASLGPPPAPAAADEARKRQMADDAAKAIREGDIETARSILQQSLAAGDQAAVMALAETYDPVVLVAMKVENVASDPQKARELYEKARTAGIKEARRRLADLTRYERRH
jgi:hypothetical protein